MNRPVGRLAIVLLSILILAAPAWLFADSLSYYRVQGDDFAYIGSSRTLQRTFENLFVPHNAHIVPSWRLLTWGFVACSGTIANLPTVVGRATFAVLPMVMLAVGLLVGRETHRTFVGLVAMAFAGLTSVLKSPATWYSAGQTLWAALGILLTLLAVQSWRRSGGGWKLGIAALMAFVAGGFWTIGHVSGFAAAAYLLASGEARCRRAALVPFLASVAAVGIYFGLGANKIEVEVRMGGTDNDKAINPYRGFSHSLQSISETLVIGNLGVAAETSPLQAAVLTASLFGLWLWTFRRGGKPTPLECAGLVIVSMGYLVEWTFRGYYPWTSLRGVVPWYDAIPHLGAVLFAAGWWSRVWQNESRPQPLTWVGAIGIVVLVLGLLLVHEPRVTRLFIAELPKLTNEELEAFPVVELQRLRSVYYAEILQKRQREHFARLDRAEASARRNGIGIDLIHKAFGRVLTPGLPPKAYDAAELLNLPRTGKQADPNRARELLAPLFFVTPEPPFPLEEVRRSRRQP
jgi:hypothetical protein